MAKSFLAQDDSEITAKNQKNFAYLAIKHEADIKNQNELQKKLLTEFFKEYCSIYLKLSHLSTDHDTLRSAIGIPLIITDI